MKISAAWAVLGLLAAAAGPARAEVGELRIPLGAADFGTLPLQVMKKHGLIEKFASAAGLAVKVNWASIAGTTANDALLAGSADLAAGETPAFLSLWDRTKGGAAVKGVAALCAMPVHLNTRAEHLRSLDDLRETDRIALASTEGSIAAAVLRLLAAKSGKSASRFDSFAVEMADADAVIALLGGGRIAAHFAPAPFHQRELRHAGVRTILSSDEAIGGRTTYTMVYATEKFRADNPKVVAVFLKALQEAQRMIKADRRAAAEVLLEAKGGRGWDVKELAAILEHPSTKYGVVPKNVLRLATLMHEAGALRHKPAALAELFFDGVDLSLGN